VVDRWIGKKIVIRSGTGVGQERSIRSNSSATINISSSWDVLPDATSKFAIVDGSWTLSVESETDLITVMLPLLTASTFEVSLRSVAKDDSELDMLESPSLVWQIGVGSVSSLDSNVPPEPVFFFGLIEEGTVSVGPIGFLTLENLASVYIGQLGLLFWDELLAPTPVALGSALLSSDTSAMLTGLSNSLAIGTLFQVEEEIVQTTGAPASGNVYPVTRALYKTTASAHSNGLPVFVLSRREMTIPFAPGYFSSTSAVGFRYNLRLPNVRISGADLVLFNRIGPSIRSEESYTGVFNYGVRTLSGGQITMNVQGYLAIEASAGNSYVVDRTTVVRDVSAYMQEPPTGANVEILVKVNGTPYCELLIEAGSHVATAVSRFNVQPLAPGATLSFDVLNVPPAAAGTPGRDLTVLLQI